MPAPEKRIFSDLLDADSAPHLVSAKAFINGQNIRFGTTDDGAIGYFESINGNTLRPVTLPAGTNICIGACADDTDRYAIFFNYNSNGDHGIYLYSITAATMYTVVLSTNITGGLNFSKYALINGAFVIDGILYFNDGSTNGQRRVNLATFMTASGSSPITADYSVTFPVDASEITLIKKPCVYPPVVTKKYDNSYDNNFLATNSYMAAIRYVYYDGEEAVLSPWSRNTFLNKATDTYNYVRIRMDETETIPQTVRLVQVVVKDMNVSKARIVKEWDRKVTADNTSINNLDLQFDFYNNVGGIELSANDMTRQFHSVPIISGTMERGRNRIDLADNTEGYNLPTSQSIEVLPSTPAAAGFTSLSKTLITVQHKNTNAGAGGGVYAYSAYAVFITELFPQGYYILSATASSTTASSTYPALGAAPGSVAESGLEYAGFDIKQVIFNTRPSSRYKTSDYLLGTSTACTVNTIGAGYGTVYPVFKHKAQRQAGVAFYDKYLRKCTVVTSSAAWQNYPVRDHLYSDMYSGLQWTLSNTGAVNQIPDWAYYYAPLCTKNYLTRSYLESYAETVGYAKRDTTTGEWTYAVSSTFDSDAEAIYIDTSALLQSKLGYTYSAGDLCTLIRDDDAEFNLQVIGQDGKYILLNAEDLGSITGMKWIYSIYTPYEKPETEPFYEFGQIYPVTNPGEVSRVYSTTSGYIPCDAFVIKRKYTPVTTAIPYYAESGSPNDLYYSRWDTDHGRINIESKLGQVYKPTGLSFSNVYIPGSQLNGLNVFDSLDKEILPVEMGRIRKLILTSKSQQEGTVMLAWGENQVASIYLGESQISDTGGNSFLARTTGYIGQINVLRGEMGTQNPESVVQYDGEVFGVDVKKRAIVRYGANGLFDIAKYGVKRAFNAFCKKFETLSTGTIEGYGSRPYIFGGIDPYHKEYLVGLPKTETTPPKGTLSDTGANYYYDIYDGLAKTWVYKMDAEKWAAPHKYEGEMFAYIGNHPYSFKAGKPYELNTNSTQNDFFGTATTSQIMFVSKGVDDIVSKIKMWASIQVESNQNPSYIHIRTETPNIQSSDIDWSNDLEWRLNEGIYEAKFLRDRLSPNVSGTASEKLIKGDKMRGPWAYILCEWMPSGKLQVKFLNVIYKVAVGHEYV